MRIRKLHLSGLLPISIAYYLTLGFLLAGAFFPEGHVWGINFWAFLPSWVSSLFFLTGAILPLVVICLSRWHSSWDISNKAFILSSAMFIGLAMLLFILLRTKTHFLGDGYTLLSLLSSDQPFIKPRNYGGMMTQFWLASLFGERTEETVLFGYRIVAFSSGLLYMLVTFYASVRLFTKNSSRLMFLLSICSGGQMLLFFGYVENYALFVASVLAFTLVGLLVSQERLSRFWLVPFFFLSIFFHIFGVTLLPATIYLMIAGTRIGKRLGMLPLVVKAAGTISLLAASVYLFYHFYATDYFFRYAIMPLFADRFTIEGYTLFSWKHLVDFANLLILLVPGLFIFIAMLFSQSSISLLKRTEIRFFFLLSLSALGAAFLFDPKFGMPRDWDLFAFAGVPVLVGGVWLFLKYNLSQEIRVTGLALVTLLGFLTVSSRATIVRNWESSVESARSYWQLDRIKSRTARHILIDMLKERGTMELAREELDNWEQTYPEMAVANKGYQLFMKGSFAEAIPFFRSVLNANPLYHDAYGLLGLSYLRLNRNDSAELYLEISDGINPYNSQILNNLGVACLRNGRFDKAESALKRSLKTDSMLTNSLLSLISLYIKQGRFEESDVYFERLKGDEDCPPQSLAMIGFAYLGKGQYERASGAYKLALKRGYDRSEVKKQLESYPKLKAVW